MVASKLKKYKQSALVAKHYGFGIENYLSVDKETVDLAKLIKKDPKFIDLNTPTIEEVCQILINYKNFTKEKGDVPLMLYFDNPASGSYDKLRKRPGEDQVSLHILGVDKSIAEAILIKTIDNILKEGGAKNYTLHINNIGGKESQTQFNREATAFFRKNISLLNANCRQFFKKNLYSLITEGGDQCKIIKEHAPEPMDFLSEESRKKFGELIERLEAFQIPYEIDSSVLGNINYSSYTTFKFVDDSSGKILAAGTRYDLLAKKIGLRKEIPAISANVWLAKSKEISELSLDKVEKSKNFILHVGQEAKTATLKLLGLMFEKKIYTKHALNRDKVSSQIQLSKKLNSEYVVILGHKEALENNVMIRDHEGRSQKVLDYDGLIDFFKKNQK